MTACWKEVVRLKLKGPDFDNHSVAVPALKEVLRFQEIVTTTATYLWWTDNPGAGRLPNNFEQSLTLRLKAIEPGSADLPLEALVEEEESAVFPGFEHPPALVEQAVQIDTLAIECAREGRPLPEKLPKKVIPLLAEWGKDLQESGNIIEITPRGGGTVAYTSIERARIMDLVESKYEDTVDIIGTVLAADLKKNHFVLYVNPDDHEGVQVAEFSPDQETIVTEALKEHATWRVRVRGKGEFSLPEGRLRVVKQVDEMIPLPTGEILFDPSTRPIWEELIELAEQVPEEELAKLPHDLAHNVDHYL